MGRGKSGGGGGGGSRGGGGSSGGSRGGSSRSSSFGGRSGSSGGRGSFGGSFGGGHGPGDPMHHGGPGPMPPHGSRRPRVYVHLGSGREPYFASGVRRVYGCLSSVIFILIFVLVLAYFSMGSCVSCVGCAGYAGDGGGDYNITVSTVNREPLESKYINESSEWYDDSDMGWIASGSTLKSGLRDFYNETGVQPYLVIVNDINGDTTPTGDEVWEYANTIYDEMFDDEGHMVFVFQCEDNGWDYTMAACTGAQAKTVVDDEALEILYDYIDHYFYSDYDEDEMFARAFSDAADRIMTKTTDFRVVVAIVIGVIAVLIVAVVIIKSVNKRAKEKAAETERILNTPVDKLDTADINDLIKKYDENK